MVLLERADGRAEFEDRHFAPAPGPQPNRHDGSTDACPHVDRPGSLPATRAVEAMHVLVADDAAEDELVKSSERDLARVRVTREHHRYAAIPERVSLLGDVREPDGGGPRVEPLRGAREIGVARVCVVEPHDLQTLVLDLDARPRVVQHLRTALAQRPPNFIGARPMIVVAQHAEHGRLEATDHVDELIEEFLAVRDEVTAEHDDVGFLRVGELDRAHLNVVGGDPTNVLIGQMCDTNAVELLGVDDRTRKAAQLEVGHAHSVAPRRGSTSTVSKRMRARYRCGVGGKWTAVALMTLLCVAHGCGAGPTFLCLDPDDCGVDGICEANGGCSFPDDTCDSGRRFARYTASANECVPLDESSTSTTSMPSGPDTLEPQTSSSSSGLPTSESSTSADLLPETTTGAGSTTSSADGTTTDATGSSSSGGQAPLYDFFDDFERPDAEDVGNGWVEKTPDSFALIDGGIRRVTTTGPYPRNLVYRPDEAWTDAETTLELSWLDTSETYGSPQCGLRIQLEDIDDPNSLTGYLLYVESSAELTITRQIAGVFTQQYSTDLSSEVTEGQLYRLRFRAVGTDPVVLDGYLEQWTGGAWELHTEVHGMDEGMDRVDSPGTLAVGGHQQVELWTYESIGLVVLD